jgi:hypothetical protein
VAKIGWSGPDEIGGSSFLATNTRSLQTFVPNEGAGSYQVAIRPYAGAGWYVEVDVLE